MPLLSITRLVLGAVTGKPATRLYPIETRAPFAATRGHIIVDLKDCSFCTLCAKKCPTDAIEVDRTGRIWRIDRLRCIQCRACVDACNKGSLRLDSHYPPPVTARQVEEWKGSPKPAAVKPAASPSGPAGPE